MSTNVSMRELFEAGVHFGHLTRFREPKMEQFIYGAKNKISIIDLEKTKPLFNEALKFIEGIANHGGKILFVGTKNSAKSLIAEYAEKISMPYVTHRWLGGMLTNYKTIKQSIRRLNSLEKMQADGTSEKLTKKERLDMSRELEKLELSLGGIKKMSGLPDALFVIDAGYEKIAIQEANRLRIPVIGIVDTNSKPDGVDYLIPGNDDAMRAIKLYLGSVVNVIQDVQDKKKAAASQKFERDEFVAVSNKGEK